MGKSAAVSIEKRMEQLRTDHGPSIRIEDVGAVVVSLVTSLGEEGIDGQAGVGSELRALLDFINRAKDELASMRPKTMSEKHIATARDELDAVVAHTEEAAGRIMDVAEKIGEIASEVDGAQSEKLMDLSTEIFEASSFQDITGQRVNKVVAVLHHIEERLQSLAEVIGDTEIEEESVEIFDKEGKVVNEEALKHGPQLDGAGNNQDDIDALLASFD